MPGGRWDIQTRPGLHPRPLLRHSSECASTPPQLPLPPIQQRHIHLNVTHRYATKHVLPLTAVIQVSLAGSSALIADAIRFPPRATLLTCAAYCAFCTFWCIVQYFELLQSYCNYDSMFFVRLRISTLFVGRTATLLVYFIR